MKLTLIFIHLNIVLLSTSSSIYLKRHDNNGYLNPIRHNLQNQEDVFVNPGVFDFVKDTSNDPFSVFKRYNFEKKWDRYIYQPVKKVRTPVNPFPEHPPIPEKPARSSRFSIFLKSFLLA